jgi:FkbM family methyltransferase
MSRNIVLRRRLPQEFGGTKLFISPDAVLKLWRFDLRKTDPMLLRIAREHVNPGDIVWDIGANVGIFSFAAAALAGPTGRILAVEADTWLVGLLRRSARACTSEVASVEVLPMALSDEVGVAKFNIARRGRASNHLDVAGGSTQTGGVREIQYVPTATLDWLLNHFPPPKFVKIDVEGAEDLVLRGAQRLLSDIRPVIMCEIFDKSRPAIDDLFHSYGYELFNAEQPRETRHPLTTSVHDTLAYPANKI